MKSQECANATEQVDETMLHYPGVRPRKDSDEYTRRRKITIVPSSQAQLPTISSSD